MPEPDPNDLSLPFVEEIYSRFVADPGAVSAEWQQYFAALADAPRFRANPRLGPSFRPASVFAPAGAAAPAASGRAVSDMVALQDRVDQLIRAYRVRGHLVARIDPLGLPRPPQPELDPAFYGLTEEDQGRTFSTRSVYGASNQTLKGILDRLRNTYCRSIGVQFMHIDSLKVKNWLQERMEGTENRLILTRGEQIRILRRLTDAVMFEEFLLKKYLGAKSFSLMGSESLIPLLDLAIEKAGDQGIREIVIGMPHRGRLNVLRNIMGKGPREIFREFDDPDPMLHLGGGDVKYHQGWSTDWVTGGDRKVHLSLCFNPSHLEYVGPVVLGRLRAKQDRVGDAARERGLPIIVHGDAAFAGEGIVQETLNLSQLEAYSVGGAVHIILNNQIGFTTSPHQSRSSPYATDVAKMLQVPIFHVNGEDPEAVAQVVRLAMEFRRTFHRDVVIDMYGYRKFGHNEGDEPAFTQPILYRAIRKKESIRESYLKHLLKLGEVTREEADDIAEKHRQMLEDELAAARSDDYERPVERTSGSWSGYVGGPDADADEVDTTVDRERAASLLEKLTDLPEGFQANPKILRLLDLRKEMARGEKPLDWASAEALAFATLATEGERVRMTGQDSERGTFSHRHAVLHDTETGQPYTPLENLDVNQAPVEIANSPLSEMGVLGFEYGYSLDYPDSLVVWEAQFGDFVNCAQVIIDQFVISAEDKWMRLSGLVMLLPHGFEGMGPEHSSARLERFLQLAAEDNMQVVNLTTPAQYFHCLRRQVLRPWRKPLIVMAPKSLLRHPLVVSDLTEIESGGVHRILMDPKGPAAGKASRVLLCSGKIYYDLAKEREERGRDDVAILRVEQLYPLADATVEAALAPYGEGTEVYWVQEEPENMGAWHHLRIRFADRILGRWPFAGFGREASASPATGSAASHRQEQEMLLDRAFGGEKG